MLVLRNFFERAAVMAERAARADATPLKLNLPWRVFVVHHLTACAMTDFANSFERPRLTQEEADATARALSGDRESLVFTHVPTTVSRNVLDGRSRGMRALLLWMRGFSSRQAVSAGERYTAETRRMLMTELYKGPTELAPDITHTFFFSGKTGKQGSLWVPPHRTLEVSRLPLPIAESAKFAPSHRAWFDVDVMCKFTKNIPHLVALVFYEVFCCLEFTRRKISSIDLPPAWISYSLSVKELKIVHPREGGPKTEQFWKFGAHVVLKDVVLWRGSQTIGSFLGEIIKQIDGAHYVWKDSLAQKSTNLPLVGGAEQSPLLLGLDVGAAYATLIATEPPDPNAMFAFFPGRQIDTKGTSGLASQGSVKIERGVLSHDSWGAELDVCRRGQYKWVHNERGDANRDAYHGILLGPSRKRVKSMDGAPGVAPQPKRSCADSTAAPGSRALMGDELRHWVRAIETALVDGQMKNGLRWDAESGASKVKTVIHASTEHGCVILYGRLSSQRCVIGKADHSKNSDHACAMFKVDTLSGLLVLNCGVKSCKIKHSGLSKDP